MLKYSKISGGKKGMSLPEVLVSVAIFGMISIAAILVVENLNHFRYINSQLEAQEAAKSALFVMTKDIRGAKNFNPTNVQPTSFAFLTMDGGAINYYIDSSTNELIKESSPADDIPLVSPITRITLLKDVKPIDASHPRIFDYAGKMITIDVEFKKPFIKNNKANMRFKTEICLRNP